MAEARTVSSPGHKPMTLCHRQAAPRPHDSRGLRALLAPPWALPPSVTHPSSSGLSAPPLRLLLPLCFNKQASCSPASLGAKPIFSDRCWSRFQLVHLVVYKWVKDRPSLLAPTLFVSSLISRKVPNSHPVAPNSNSYTLRHLK